jgi:cell division protease FtsH
MVGSLGFSDAFGLLSVAGVPKELLGPDIQAAVLREARVLLERAQATCQQLLKANRAQLDALAQRLLEREVVSGDELKGLLGVQVSEFVGPAFKSPPAMVTGL